MRKLYPTVKHTAIYLHRILLLVVLFFIFNLVKAQQVTEVITNFGGFWKSGMGALNPVFPNTSHNVLSFKYNTVNYSTGVDDNKLINNSIPFTAADYRAFPVATVGGTVTNGASIYIALASQYDGIPNGYSNPLPSLKIKDVLIDGVHGLDIGTGATNIPASALINFPISSVIPVAISDAIPDILVSQVASPTATGDTLYLVNSSGNTVGNKVSINWTTISKIGTYYLDLYSLPNGALCDTARITGTADKETTREIRLVAFRLEDFGITGANATSVAGFILKASGSSDPAFIAYNTNSFIIPSPVITVQPVSQVVCPTGVNSVTFSVTATGGSLTYQWKKNNVNIPGATSSTFTIPNVNVPHAGVYTVEVSNPVGSVVSDPAYLNISVMVQPNPASQLIATGASCTLSISATNATAYQWKMNGADIPGATSETYTINPVTTANQGHYSVELKNPAGNGCANITSNVITLTGATTLYSKPGANLNQPSSWGVVSNGSGSSPVDFTRPEHRFVVKNNSSTGGNLTISGTLDVADAVMNISANSTLDVGKLARSGSGSIASSETSSLTVRGNSDLYFQAGNDFLKNFTVYAGDINLLSRLSVAAGATAGKVTMNGGNLFTNDNLAFKSNAAGTASLAPVASDAAITGKATIERYIPAAKGWRLLCVPVSSPSTLSINDAWQEGLTTASANPNLYPGYGIKISGGTTQNGFDQSSTNSSFIKAYNNSSNSFVPLPANPGTNIPITTYPGYFVYIRGDRGVDLMQGLNASITSTTLRVKGNIRTGDQVIGVNAGNYTLVGNPYPSAVDFGSLVKSNVTNSMYMWDPKLAGNYGLGGYVTLSYNSHTGNYDKTASSSPVSQYIQSGEAFLVKSADRVNPGTLRFTEQAKSTAGSDQVYRVTGVGQQVRVNLYSVGAGGLNTLLDGVLSTYDDNNNNNVDDEDAVKLNNSNENIGIRRDGNLLSIERRKTIIRTDTTFLKLTQVRIQSYRLEIVMDNMANTGTIAMIRDNYSNTINNMPLDMNGTTNINFSINADPGSYAPNRFSIVFGTQAPLPVTFKSFKAYKQGADIAVEWFTDNEINITTYAIERSADGTVFEPLGNKNAKAIGGGSAAYTFLDTDPLAGVNYYRVRSISKDGEMAYTGIVKVILQPKPGTPTITVYPNPITGNTASLQFSHIEPGYYTLQLFNHTGQLLSVKKVSINGSTSTGSFEINQKFPRGKYELKLSGEAHELTIPVFKK